LRKGGGAFSEEAVSRKEVSLGGEAGKARAGQEIILTNSSPSALAGKGQEAICAPTGVKGKEAAEVCMPVTG